MQALRWSCAIVLLTAIVALYLGAMIRASDDLHRLERLAQRIEHSPRITPEIATSVARALDTVRQHGAHNASVQADARREAAIERVMNAVRSKETLAAMAAR